MYQIKGKIDSTNAPEFEKEIMASKPTELDASELEYISSAGLRVLLKLTKTVGDVTVINVSSEVYEIFDVTGFTQILKVQKAYRNIDIGGLRLIGKGMTGSVYRIDEDTVVKVFNPNINFDLIIKQENDKARNAFIAGIPTAIPYDIVRVGDNYGTVYELLKAKDLVTVIAEDKVHMDDYIRDFAKTVKDMHSTKVNADQFESLNKKSIAAVGYLSSVLTPEETEKVRAIYANIPERDTFIHGDCHIGNAMVQDGSMMFIDLATAGMGHPIYDMVSMYSLFQERAHDQSAINDSPILRNFTQEEIIRIWNVFIRAYLNTGDEEIIKKAERQIAGLSATRRLFMVIAMPGTLSTEAFSAMKQNVIAYHDAGLDPICF
ncbi:MAG: phosphotransferase [Ruminococcus sp.]|nr:phosphotransferase [Ruminococcus sp.]